MSHTPGHDFSGVVAALGPDCNTDLSVGSEVYAFTSRRNHEGALAEYALADQDQVTLKPRNLDFSQAATVPLSALTAWQALHDHGNLQKGQKLLVTGAAGGTGVFAVQLAKLVGAKVVATGSSSESREILERFGVDEFIDYKTANLESTVHEVDLVLDCVGGKVLNQCLKTMRADGRLLSIVTWDVEEQAKHAKRDAKFFIVHMDSSQLSHITKLLEDETVKPVLDRGFPLNRTREAFEYAGRGHVHGKVVVNVQGS